MPDSNLCVLPPLILHPFSNSDEVRRLAESTGSNLTRNGPAPRREQDRQSLRVKLLEGRFSEIVMLYYIGKDVVRWIEQCLEFSRRHEQLRNSNLRFQSFADFLTCNPPQHVMEKLGGWGVHDFRAIFSRAIGLNTIFDSAPRLEWLSEEFVRDHHGYADQVFAFRQRSCVYRKIDPTVADFQVFTSGEYSKILERGLLDQV